MERFVNPTWINFTIILSFRLLLFSFFHITISFHLSFMRHICLIFTLTCTLRCTVKNHNGSPPVWVDLLICEMGWKCEWGARRRRTVIYKWRQFYMEMGGKECDPEAWCPSPLQWNCMIEPHKCQPLPLPSCVLFFVNFSEVLTTHVPCGGVHFASLPKACGERNSGRLKPSSLDVL